MSDSWASGAPHNTTSGGDGEAVSGKADTAKHEAAEVAGTAVDTAKDVAHTAKDEASSVVGEAKSQARDLLHQTRGQLSDQAAAQQQRIAGGLQSAGSELRSMADSGDGGIATDLVRQTSERLSAVGDWIGDRDPAALLDEVKRFARRRPLVFIAGAAVAGIVVGRLTRALASGGSSSGGSSSGAGTSRPQLPATPAATAAGTPAGTVTATYPDTATSAGGAESPLYDESASRLGTVGEEVSDDRRDAF